MQLSPAGPHSEADCIAGSTHVVPSQHPVQTPHVLVLPPASEVITPDSVVPGPPSRAVATPPAPEPAPASGFPGLPPALGLPLLPASPPAPPPEPVVPAPPPPTPESDRDPPLPSGHPSQAPHREPSVAQVCAPSAPPGQAQLCVLPGSHPGAAPDPASPEHPKCPARAAVSRRKGPRNRRTQAKGASSVPAADPAPATFFQELWRSRNRNST